MDPLRRSAYARALLELAAPLLIGRALLVAAALLAVASLPLNAGQCLECAPSGIPWLDAFARWDGRWYVSIAETGYVDRPGQQSNLAFFPVYPLLIKLVAAPFGGDRPALVAAGVAVANAALVVALVSIVRLARSDADAGSARRAAIYVIAYPTTILLSAVNAESTFLALAATAFWSARQGRWTLAGALSALAALTRPFGILLAVALSVELLGGSATARRKVASLGLLALSPLALASWAAYLFSLTGRPLAFVEAHGPWAVRPANALGAFSDLLDPNVYGFPWIVAALLALAVVLSAYAWRLRRSYGAYCTLILVAMMSPGTFTSSMRHELLLFPAFIVLGTLGARRSVHRGYLTIGGMLALLFAAMYALSYWIG